MNITYTSDCWDEYLYWQQTDKQTLKKINQLLKYIKRDLFNGIGKPKPLKYEFSGCWSGKITDEHRLVYEVIKYSILVISCRFHY